MIVNRLIQIQQKDNLTDEEFAQRLGIHRVSWLRNKRTKVISPEVLLKAFEAYPELKEIFFADATRSHTVTSHNRFPATLKRLPMIIYRGICKALKDTAH